MSATADNTPTTRLPATPAQPTTENPTGPAPQHPTTSQPGTNTTGTPDTNTTASDAVGQPSDPAGEAAQPIRTPPAPVAPDSAAQCGTPPGAAQPAGSVPSEAATDTQGVSQASGAGTEARAWRNIDTSGSPIPAEQAGAEPTEAGKTAPVTATRAAEDTERTRSAGDAGQTYQAAPTYQAGPTGEAGRGPGSEAAGPNRFARLRRSRSERMLAGVCGGLAQPLGIDPVWLRLILVLATMLGFGLGVVIYLACWILMPLED